MARIRSVKPSFWSDPAVSRCSIPARLTLIGLWSESDDQGRQLYSPMKLSGTLYPVDQISVRKLDSWIKELDREALIHFYEVERITYLCVPNLRRHQVISKPSKSVLPPCPTHGELHDDSGSSPGPDPDEAPGSPRGDSTLGSRRLEVGKGEGGGELLAPAAPTRPPDPLFEALCRACGIDWHDLTETGRGAVNAALKQLRAVGATPEELDVRARNYVSRFPEATLTPTALAKHWAQSARPAQPVRPADPGDRARRKAAELREREGREALSG